MVVAAVSVTVHAAGTASQPPPFQPMKDRPLAGTGVKVTIVPSGKVAQPGPHEVPLGASVTVPGPRTLVFSMTCTVFGLKVADTVASTSSRTEQAPLPAQDPPQPPKVELLAGVWVTVTWVPS